MTTTRIRASLLLAAAALLLSACSDDANAPPATETTTPSETAPETVEPTTPADDVEQTSTEPELSAEEQDEADIEETLRLYVGALDDARTGEASIEGIYPYSRGTAREKWVTQVLAYEAQGITIEGRVDLEVVELNVEGDSATVIACADVSKTDAFDESGESIVPAGRLDRTLNDFVFERDSSAETGWYVSDDVNRNEPCDG